MCGLCTQFSLVYPRSARGTAAVGIAQGTASTLLEALVRDGRVARSEDSADRRVTKMVATPKGVQQAELWQRAYKAAAEELFAPLPRSRWTVVDIMSPQQPGLSATAAKTIFRPKVSHIPWGAAQTKSGE